jgi:membrane protein DedA with SNARE-associated domain
MELLGFSFQTIDGWIEAGGYVALFGLLFACGLGLPLPEDIPLMIAGALVAKGKMDLTVACIVAWSGIMGGDVVLYHLGKRFGLEITKVPFIGKHVTRERIQRVEQMFERYGIGVVAIGRMFAGVRGAMVVAAGAIRYNFLKFFIADGLAAIVSGGFFVFVGHWLGTRLNQETIKEFKWWFIGIAVLLAIAFIGWIFWRKKRAVERMEKVTAKVEHVAGVVAHAAHLTSDKPEKRDPTASP